jgi:CBS domain-containing membrane protein
MSTKPMQVEDLMTAKVFALRPGDDLGTLHDLMLDHDVRHVPVVDRDGDLVGLVSHRDLLRNALIEQPVPGYVERAVLERLAVRDVMVSDVESIAPDADLREAAQTMFENKYGCLPVVVGRRLVGILTEADFVRLMAQGE